MFCPFCGRAMTDPKTPAVPYPMHICAADGVVYDRRRDKWYGTPEVGDKLCCPACGGAMDSEPTEPPIRIFFCYQCGTTYDKVRASWYGLSAHHGAE